MRVVTAPISERFHAPRRVALAPPQLQTRTLATVPVGRTAIMRVVTVPILERRRVPRPVALAPPQLQTRMLATVPVGRTAIMRVVTVPILERRRVPRRVALAPPQLQTRMLATAAERTVIMRVVTVPILERRRVPQPVALAHPRNAAVTGGHVTLSTTVPAASLAEHVLMTVASATMIRTLITATAPAPASMAHAGTIVCALIVIV